MIDQEAPLYASCPRYASGDCCGCAHERNINTYLVMTTTVEFLTGNTREIPMYGRTNRPAGQLSDGWITTLWESDEVTTLELAYKQFSSPARRLTRASWLKLMDVHNETVVTPYASDCPYKPVEE